MVAQSRKALSRGVNCYVPGMAYASDLVHSQPTAFSLGKPAAAAISALSANVGAANALATFAVNFELDSTYGRGIRIDLSGVPGNAPVVRVIGEDYLGQPLAKDFTGSAAATTTTASGVAAFKRITAVRVTVASTNAVNIQLGTLGVLGLPYKGNMHGQRKAIRQTSLTPLASSPRECSQSLPIRKPSRLAIHVARMLQPR
jgi:hypothetical protein